MDKTINATFDGEVFRPDEPVDLEANAKVLLEIKEIRPRKRKTKLVFAKKKPGGKPYAFIDTALSMRLEGLPPDYSENLDEYLYHGKPFPDEE